MEKTMPNYDGEQELKPDWDDRCVSCTYLNKQDCCSGLWSNRYGDHIQKPKATKCVYYSYKFRVIL